MIGKKTGWMKTATEISEIPKEVRDTADQYGFKINDRPSGAIEFMRPNGHPFYLISRTPEAFSNVILTMKNEVAGKSNWKLAEDLEKTAEIVEGKWQKQFGYSWKHDVVKVNGIEVGRIQQRKGNKNDTISCSQKSCVIGFDKVWIIAQALSKGILKVPGAMPVTE